jgi:predicted DNA-binding protein (MmcQ/YjbR family)
VPVSEAAVLKRLRTVCLRLPEAQETVTFGHPTFQIRGKTFCVLEHYHNELSICFKVGKQDQDLFLADERYYRTPYIGQHGWVSLKVHAAPLDWVEIRGLVEQSYGMFAPKGLKTRN